jgi:hypothetical protein
MSATRNVQRESRLGMGSRVNQAVGPFIPSQVSGNVALSCRRHRGRNRVPCLCLPMCGDVVYSSVTRTDREQRNHAVPEGSGLWLRGACVSLR